MKLWLGAHKHSTVARLLPMRNCVCRYMGTNTTLGKVKIYFKSNNGVGGSSAWSSWVKVAPVTPPAASLPVGGTSRLKLLLRQDFYTVQNLSRVGAHFSFTRPLDDGSTLPFLSLIHI